MKPIHKKAAVAPPTVECLYCHQVTFPRTLNCLRRKIPGTTAIKIVSDVSIRVWIVIKVFKETPEKKSILMMQVWT